jgi:hypothetical protein
MPLPDRDAALAKVKAIRAKYPRDTPGGSPLGDEGAYAIIEVAQAFGAKVFRKEGGERVLIRELGKSCNRTIIGQGAFGNVWVKVFGDGEGTAFPIWNIGDTPADGEYLDVSGIVVPGATQPPPPPPSGDRVADLEHALRQMRDIADRVL